MKLVDAIKQTLAEAGTELSVKQITEIMLRDGLWSTSGKTPANTVAARLHTDVNQKGEKSDFIKVAPNTFALRNAKVDDIPEIPSVTDEMSQLKPNSLPFMEAAKKVLEEHGGRKPMHYRDITKIAIEKGWLVSSGKTPESSMYAQIITDIKKRKARGEHSSFVQYGRGMVGLSRWTRDGLGSMIEDHNKDVRQALLNRLLNLTPAAFEELVSQLLAEMGFETVEVTKVSGDGGIDVRGVLVVGDAIEIKMAIQAKRWRPTHRVQSPIIQQVRGSLGAHEQGLIITTSDFSSGAIKEATQADKAPIALINGEQLVLLLMEYGIGVTRSTPDLYEVDDEAWTKSEPDDDPEAP